MRVGQNMSELENKYNRCFFLSYYNVSRSPNIATLFCCFDNPLTSIDEIAL